MTDHGPTGPNEEQVPVAYNIKPSINTVGMADQVLEDLKSEEQELARRKVRWMVDKLKFYKVRSDQLKGELKKLEDSYAKMESKLREVNRGNHSLLNDIKLED